ncbi:galactose mutarotase [Cognatishimia sp. SS12]|uniref:aldose epimerase family protein n=1 Tax=Cognatishimia sp. SS12 TaxID=2979465 RepID=UPI00232DFA43|nr:aldose epimerase family protein [Cognatishimia sp. SS12]MDC0739182.1 galactose mutarotase [Cognatishimia sp. SS12]
MTVTHCVTLEDGRKAQQVTLAAFGMTAKIVTLGAALQDLRIEGVAHPLILGFQDIAAYANNQVCMGAIAGRFANRIADAQITIDAEHFALDANWLGKHALHGGRDGLQYWNWTLLSSSDRRAEMTVTLPDGHMGYPGALTINCVYEILSSGTLDLTLTATTDKPTICGLASHCYFNLDGRPTIDKHLLTVPTYRALVYDDEAIATGEIEDITGTRRDYQAPKGMADGLFDGNFCLSDNVVPLRDVAYLSSTAGGPRLTMRSNQPGLQAYNAPKFAPPATGLAGQRYGDFAGLALEPQNWPNAPRFDHFPNAILRPGETYDYRCQFAFD